MLNNGIKQGVWLLFFASMFSSLWSAPKTSLLSGIGNYESLYIGIQKQYPSKLYWETSVGVNPIRPNYQMMYILAGGNFKKWKKNEIKLGFHCKILLWHLNNAFNRFLVFTPNPECRLEKTYKKFSFSLSAGYLYNTPLYYKRKTFQEVGWPKEWEPSFSIQLQYHLP